MSNGYRSERDDVSEWRKLNRLRRAKEPQLEREVKSGLEEGINKVKLHAVDDHTQMIKQFYE